MATDWAEDPAFQILTLSGVLDVKFGNLIEPIPGETFHLYTERLDNLPSPADDCLLDIVGAFEVAEGQESEAPLIPNRLRSLYIFFDIVVPPVRGFKLRLANALGAGGSESCSVKVVYWRDNAAAST